MTTVNANNLSYPDPRALQNRDAEARVAFQELDKTENGTGLAGDGKISRDTLEKYGAGVLGVNQADLDRALNQSDASSFSADDFASLAGQLAPSGLPGADFDDATTLGKGRHNDPAAVQQLQAQLKDGGFYDGGIDGKFGPKTEAALKAFQQSVGLEPDGKAGPATLEALGAKGQADAAIQQADQRQQFYDQHPEVPTDKQKALVQAMQDGLGQAQTQAFDNPEETQAAEIQSGADAILKVCQGPQDLPAMAKALADMQPHSREADAMSAAMFQVMRNMNVNQLKADGETDTLQQLGQYVKQIQDMRTPTYGWQDRGNGFLTFLLGPEHVDTTNRKLDDFANSLK